MPETTYRISELTAIDTINNGDLVEVSTVDANSESGYASRKASMTDLGNKLLNGIEYSTELVTNDKRVFGAINEIAQGGGSVDITTEIDTPAPIMTFNDGGDNIPMKSLVTEIVPIQSGTGTPSPDNVRSISGFSNCSIHKFESGKLPSDTIIYTRYISTQDRWTTASDSRSIAIPVEKNTTYTITGYSDQITLLRIGVLHGDLPASSSNYATCYNVERYTSYAEVGKAFTYTTDSSSTYLIIQTNASLIEDFITNGYVAPSTTVVIALGQTVYGGSLECVEGQGISEWVNIASYAGETIEEPWLCSEAPFVSGTTPPTGSQVVYKTSTPTSISVTVANIPTLSGVNNICTNCGDIQSLEYFNENANDIGSLIELESGRQVDLFGTLTTGQTTVTISSSAITTSSSIDVYTDTFGVNPTNIVVTDGQIVLTFDAQASDLGVKVRVS